MATGQADTSGIDTPGCATTSNLPQERAADHVRNGLGSWSFVIVALVFIAGWMVGNRNTGFDPYPFILLNLVLSCLAALQGAILLIAAKRADQITAELSVHDYETNSKALMLVREMHAALVGKPELSATSGNQTAEPQPPSLRRGLKPKDHRCAFPTL